MENFNTQMQITAIVIFLIVLISGWIVGIRIAKRCLAHRAKMVQEPASAKRIRYLQKIVLQDVRYYDDYTMLPVDDQRVVNAVLQQPPENNLDEYVASDSWQYAKFTNTVGTYVSFYSFDLEAISFEIMMRKTGYSSAALRFFMQIIERKQLTYVEGVIDKDYDVFCPQGLALETLSILSPEVLNALHHSPRDATVLIKRNKLFYVVYGSSKIEDDYVVFRGHATRAVRELNDNLKRFNAGSNNKAIIDNASKNPVGMSDEEYYSQPEGKYFTTA